MGTKASNGRARRKATTNVQSVNDISAFEAPIVRMAACIAESRAAERRAMIADAAYFRAERRGFVPGHELEDWLAAELDVANMQQHDASVAFQG